MQSYSQNAQQSNIFQQIRAWKAQRADRLTNADVTKIASLRSDKTHSDEALLVTKAILIFVTIFTSYCGYLFYLSTFSKIFDPSQAWLAAVGLAIVTEAAKIFLLHRFLRSIFFGWIQADWWSFGGWLFIGALAIGAYWWSVRISTDGMNMFTIQMAEAATPRDNLNALIHDATADIDAQINATRAAQSDAMNTKWKGTTTWRAQKIAGSSAASIASLQEQRAAIVKQTTDDYRNGSAHRETTISSWADWIRKYGGYMEAIAALCIFSIVFFERRLVFLHGSAAPAAPTTPAPNGSQPNGRSTGSPIAANTPPAGNAPFSSNDAGPVRDSPSLTGETGLLLSRHDGDFIRLRLRSLKGWDDNFQKPGNRPGTVAGNMCRILNEIGLQMHDPRFRPDQEAVADLLEYITKVGFPTMHQNGYTYKYENDLTNLCAIRLPATAAAA